MADGSLIVPVLTNTSLQFATIRPDGVVQDLLDALTALDEVHNDILGDLPSQQWAIQNIRNHRCGRPWEEEELEALEQGANRAAMFELHDQRESRRPCTGNPCLPTSGLLNSSKLPAATSFLCLPSDVAPPYADVAACISAPATLPRGLFFKSPRDP